jgi:hypothetical protein
MTKYEVIMTLSRGTYRQIIDRGTTSYKLQLGWSN